MEVTEKTLSFHILHGSREATIYLSEYDSVRDLKLEISKNLIIAPSKQIISCWANAPEDDNDTLAKCCDSETNYLVVYECDNLNDDSSVQCDNLNVEMESIEENSSFHQNEISAAVDFIEYFSNNFDDRGILFHVCRLEDAISKACFTSLENRKILCLYFHNKSDKFAKIFAEHLVRPEVKELVNERFFFLGWDIENEVYHEALMLALSYRTELASLVNFIESRICAALLIVPIKNSFTVFSCIKSKVSKKDFLTTLKKAEEFLMTENEIEKDLEDSEQNENDIGSSNYQQIMLDLLGDRDYDSFDHFEFDLLKKKIGYALYGPPENENGYDEKQTKKISFLFDIIVKQNNIFAKWKDRIVISFIYNCTEPLPSDKQKRSKKYKNYNPNTDLTPVPIFVLRKCKDSPNPCRIFIDDTGRVYKTWQSYLTRNKLPKCEMILPLNGRYQADENGNVILERHLSPACGIDVMVLQGTDMASTAAGLVSGGILIAAAIPTVTVAPVALVAAGATGLGVGLYSLGRSAYTLYDRTRHKESLSFSNSEARGAYLSIVAGSLGFVGVGANAALTQLASSGLNIGQGATATVNVINMANLGASGISVVNSGYDVFDQWFNENRRPSLLTIVQLSSSILFFGHAVYNFKLAATIIEESQAQTLRDYHDSLRSNRHRKTFNKMMKETIRQNDGDMVKGRAEVIKTISKIQNKDEVFATLTRLNKKMNENNVKFSADNGDIKLNGVSIDMAKFGSLENNEVATFLSTLPSTPELTQNDITALNTKLEISFKGVSSRDIQVLGLNLFKIFANTEQSIKDKIINAVAMVIMELMQDHSGCFRELNKIFPGIDKYLRLFRMVSGFFQHMIDVLEEKYQKWLATKDSQFEENFFPCLALEFSKRSIQLFDHVSDAYFIGTNLTDAGLRSLIDHFYTWFAKQVLAYEEYKQRKQERIIHSSSAAKRTRCPDCGGIYYQE